MLEGKKIRLRPLKIQDLEKTKIWRNNIELIINTQGIRFPKTVEIETIWFEHVLHDTSNKNIYFGIEEMESNELIGLIQINNIDYISRIANWGLILGDHKKRKSNASFEAAKLLFNYAFNILNLNKLTGYVVAFNKPAIIFNQLVGEYKLEGTLKNHNYYNNEYHDVLIFSFFKEDYIKDQGQKSQ